jgi:hypothetical protein
MVASICVGIVRVSGVRELLKYLYRTERIAKQVLFHPQLKQGAEWPMYVLDIHLTILSAVAQIAHLTKGPNYE